MEKMKFVDQDKIEDIFSAIRLCKNPFMTRDRALIQCAYFCGMRISEVTMLRWYDYIPRTKSLFIHRLKNGKSGTIRLQDKAAHLLNAWFAETQWDNPDDFIFCTRSGAKLSRQRIDQLFREYCKVAKIRKNHRHFHILRHSIAVHLLDSGVDIVDVQEHLGHKNIRNTLIYARYTSRRARRFNELVSMSKYIAK